MPSPTWYPPVKRLTDLLAGLLLLVPALVVLAVAVPTSLLLHGRPVLFIQPRVGRRDARRDSSRDSCRDSRREHCLRS